MERSPRRGRRYAQRVPHRHGSPCWQPHWQVEATGAGPWQPQVQAAPAQSVQGQVFSRVFIGQSPGRSGAGRKWPAVHILVTLAAADLNVWADRIGAHG